MRVETENVEYLCPGDGVAIGRAVHLGRLVGYYPACRTCPHRDQTGSLARRQVERLVAARRRAEAAPLFYDEGVAGVFWNQLDPAVARRLGVALGIMLRDARPAADELPVVVIGGDARPAAPELVAAAAEGLRWTGCHVVDVGEASAPCVAFAVDHLAADGGLLVGNPTGRAHEVGVWFWTAAAEPVSAGGSLERLQAAFEAGADRPTRKSGAARRFSADAAYLAGLAEHYHGLRPLRLVLGDCPNFRPDENGTVPFARYLQQLTAATACRVLPFRAGAGRLAQQVVDERAHFGAVIDEDGQRCRLVDERGRMVAGERLLLLVSAHLLETQPGGTIVLEHDTPEPVAAEIVRRGGHVVTSGTSRAEMHAAMRWHTALFGGGPSGRLWYRSVTGHVAADALWTLTLVLKMLSQSDRPLSAVLDDMAPSR